MSLFKVKEIEVFEIAVETVFKENPVHFHPRNRGNVKTEEKRHESI
jgi:hypothetical protein